jgi:hypothetical protein
MSKSRRAPDRDAKPGDASPGQGTDIPREVLDAARQELENPSDETDEG